MCHQQGSFQIMLYYIKGYFNLLNLSCVIFMSQLNRSLSSDEASFGISQNIFADSRGSEKRKKEEELYKTIVTFIIS